MKILIRGAGDLATGIAAELWERGHQILMTDVAIPLTVRREVAFSRAVYEEHAVVEGMEAVLAENFEEAETIMATRKIAVMVDEKAEVRKEYLPDVLVDGIMAKDAACSYLIPSKDVEKILQSNSDMPSITIITNFSLCSCI